MTSEPTNTSQNCMTDADLADFVARYQAGNRHLREETERFRCFTYSDVDTRDKANLDIIWLQDETLGDPANLPDPTLLAEEIAEEMAATLSEFAQIGASLRVRTGTVVD